MTVLLAKPRSRWWLYGLVLGGCAGPQQPPAADQHSAPAETEGAETPAPTAATAAVEEPSGPANATLTAVLQGPYRSAENRARDVFRHPAQTLAFFGAQPDMQIIEIRPGGGWYTEILAPWIKGRGELTIATVDPNGESARYTAALTERMKADPELFGAVKRVVFEAPQQDNLGEPDSADMVLTFRNCHGWYNAGVLPQAMASFYTVLKPGGILGIVQHRAKPGSDPSVTGKNGYLAEDYVISVANSAGFTLEAKSEINANPKDTTDHPGGVWTLPPTLRLGEENKDHWLSIGESDRMTLKFRKPAQ